MELAAEEYKKAVQKMMEADAKSAEGASIGDKLKSWFVRSAASGDTSGYLLNADLSPEAFAKEKEEKLRKEAESLFKSGTELVQRYIQFSEEEQKTLEAIGIKTTDTIREGSVRAIKAAIASMQQELEDVTAPKEYKRIEDKIKAEQAKLDAITGGKPKKSHYVDSYQQAEEIKKASQLIKDAFTKSEIDIQEQQIALMDEGSEKQLAQIRLDYEKRYQEIAKEERELLQKLQDEERKQWEKDNPDYKKKNLQFTPTITSLTSGQREPFDKEYSLAYQKQEKDTQSLLNKLLEKYKSYEQRRTDINKQFDAERKAIENGKTADGKDIAQNVKDAAIVELEKKRKKAMKEVNDEEVTSMQKSSDLLIKLFEDASNKSVSEINKIMSDVEGLLDYLSKTKTEDITPQFGFTTEQLQILSSTYKCNFLGADNKQ